MRKKYVSVHILHDLGKLCAIHRKLKKMYISNRHNTYWLIM